MASVEEIIADFVKGAQRAGGRVQLEAPGIETSQSMERTPKVANNYGGLGGALLGPLGAAIGSDPGRGWQAAGGALVGGTLGNIAGTGIGLLAHNPQLANLLAAAGGTVGSGVGGHMLGADDRNAVQRATDKLSSLNVGYAYGAKAAADRFKVAFAPLVAAGLSALAPAATRGIMSRIAPKALGAIAKPIAGALFDTGTQMAAQKALG